MHGIPRGRAGGGPGPLAGLASPGDAAMIVRVVVNAVAFAWAPAVLILRLRRPRPPLRRLGRQPGAVACLAVALAGINQFVLASYVLFLPRRDVGVEVKNILLGMSSVQFIAPAVALAWIVLAFCGRWRPDPGWPDRLGRAVGVV